MKQHHQAEFNGIGNGNLGSFAATPPDQPLPAQSGHSIQKYLEQIETAPKKPDMVQVIKSNHKNTWRHDFKVAKTE